MPALPDFAAIFAVSATTFVATSLDNLLILVGFQTSNSIPTRSISLGFLAAMMTMIGVALTLAAAADAGLPFPVGYLGLAPIAIGLYHGVKAFQPDPDREAVADSFSREGVAGKRAIAGFASVFLTMLANSGDSLLVFTALIADTKRQADLGILATVLVMAGAWVWVARWLSGHPRLREPLQGFARFGLPILLIGVGLYILTDSPTDVVLRP
jgi:cadmium resistance protein CadD (predicted permease)